MNSIKISIEFIKNFLFLVSIQQFDSQSKKRKSSPNDNSFERISIENNQQNQGLFKKKKYFKWKYLFFFNNY